jgi:hypothetical protein
VLSTVDALRIVTLDEATIDSPRVTMPTPPTYPAVVLFKGVASDVARMNSTAEVTLELSMTETFAENVLNAGPDPDSGDHHHAFATPTPPMTTGPVLFEGTSAMDDVTATLSAIGSATTSDST